MDGFKISIDLLLAEHDENLNLATTCRYDSFLGLLTKKCISLIHEAKDGTLELNKTADVLEIISKDLSDPVRSHKYLDKDASPYFRKSVQYYEELAKQLVSQGHVLDLFVSALDQKEAQGVSEKRKGRRGPGSVIGSSAAGCVCVFLSIYGVGRRAFFQLCKLGFVASFCTKLSDTVSSEIGKAYGNTATRNPWNIEEYSYGSSAGPSASTSTKRILSLDKGLLISGAKERGDLEGRVTR
ncbi:hypothetical protein POM88_031963 [Heracleum sosnowskyi]|uniref:Uncharacterized protein n=1 Tax=Heracleum sosnowskyi TaxID=360622 RepID=A0AAD8HZ78_9APIA|nr:hypothetical protein POM88_031963 [Heracleum sosnowskyi]